MHVGKTSATTKFQNPIGKTILVSREKSFASYVPYCAHICRKNRLFEVQASSFLYYTCDEGRYRKNVNAFKLQ